MTTEDKQPTREQIKEFWEWCGLRQIVSPKDDLWHRGIWLDEQEMRLDTPDIDLNNLFKYAVPKLLQKGNYIELYAEPSGNKYKSTIYSDSFTQDGIGGWEPFLDPIAEVKNTDPALALFWTIWEVIHAKV